MFLLRTTTMPSLVKLTELERIVAVDNAGPNIAVGAGLGRACLVGEFPSGPFNPTIVRTAGDIAGMYMPDTTKMGLISQGGFDPSSSAQDGSGVSFDGNGWAELKGKTFSGLVIKRVDMDMVVADSSIVKAYVAFTITVNAADLTGGVTNKPIIIPAGTRFADNAIGTATVVIATSQKITIPAGTTCGGSLSIGISFTQDALTGELTYVASGATTGATCFFVKGQTIAIAGIDTLVDGISGSNPLPGVNAGTVLSGTPSTINISAAATAIYAPAGGGAQGANLAATICLNYPNAISSTLPGTEATDDIVAIWSARNWHGGQAFGTNIKAIRTALWNNAIAASKIGRGRVANVTCAPATAATSTARTTAVSAYTALVGTTDTVTGDDADRYWACGPYMQVFSSELNANITISACGTRAAMKVNLLNAGQSQFLSSVGSPYNADVQAVDSQEACFALLPLAESEFIAMKAAGISWFTRDRSAGWWFYSGVTAASPLTASSRVDDNRRSFADEIQDVIFGLAAKYSKLPGTTERQDAFAGDMRVYLESLVNTGVGESRAAAYRVKEGADAGNTQTLNGQGIFLYSVEVTMYGSQKTIVINTAIGPTVVIAQAA